MIELDWDSRLFKGKAGRVEDHDKVPDASDLSSYKYVHVRIPHDKVALVWEYQKAGFRYITHDITLVKAPAEVHDPVVQNCDLLYVRKEEPTFKISGFELDGSRLVIDPQLRSYLGRNFWDETIREHCREFADFALCAVNPDNRLMGFASCFDHADNTEVFLFVVHPDFRKSGVGSVLLQALGQKAFKDQKKLSTSVVSSNLQAMNFYLKHRFLVSHYHVIMHYSKH